MSTLQAGRGITIQRAMEGQVISRADAGKPWRHPWFVRPAWSARAQRWIATVKPGFVNGRAPIWRTTVKEQAAAQVANGINPLTGKPFFSDPVFAQPKTTPATERTIDIPLTLSPAIPLVFRALGFDGASDEAVPAYFVRLGAAQHPQLNLDAIAGGDLSSLTPDVPQNLRLLRAADVWVHQPRFALTSDITFPAGLVTGAGIATQTLGLRSAVPGDKLRVMTGKLTPPPGIDPTRFDFEDVPWDELLIATVFLLSPPHTPSGSAPDASWLPFVRHGLFWNLNYVPATPAFSPADPTIPFLPPLAAGAAQLVTNYLIASINDLTQQALNLVTAHDLSGTFYTPTGGGHDATFPEEPIAPAQGRTGLDKAGRLAARAVAARRAAKAAKLDPDFPFTAVLFDPALLST